MVSGRPQGAAVQKQNFRMICFTVPLSNIILLKTLASDLCCYIFTFIVFHPGERPGGAVLGENGVAGHENSHAGGGRRGDLPVAENRENSRGLLFN